MADQNILKKALTWAGLATFGGLAITGIAMATRIESPPALDPETLCRKDGTRPSHTLVLVDRTDVFRPYQEAIIREAIDEVRDSAPVGGNVSVHVLTGDASTAGVPLFELCNPGNGDDTSQVTGNPDMKAATWKRKFSDPLDQELADMFLPGAADASPLIEAIAAVSEHADKRATVRTLVVVSDFLENSAIGSHYRGTVASPDKVLATDTGLRLAYGLGGVRVRLVRLPNPDQLARQEATEDFWLALLSGAGAETTFED